MTDHMTGLVTVFGYGATGRATVERLRARGAPVRVVQRKRPADLPRDVAFQTCDVLDAQSVLAAMQGAEQAVITIGFEYSGKAWRVKWPKAMANFIAAAEATGARVVHIDNLYMYGPQTAPLTEDMPLTNFGLKPAARAEASRMWMQACAEGRIRWAALRAPDFYGPGVTLSHIGATGLQAVAQGKPAMLLMEPDQPHDFAYVPDIGRAAVSLLDAADDAFGQAWHVPCAPTTTARDVLQIGADALGQKLKMIAIPSWLLQTLGVVSPMMKEYAEMRFTWNRPYHVDSSKFAKRFWGDATLSEVGVRETVMSFRDEARPASRQQRAIALA